MKQIPVRVFLDSSTLQTLQDFGDFIYDGSEIAESNKIWTIPDGYKNIDALRKIMIVGNRGAIQLALSQNSLREVIERGKYDYLQWAMEMLEYWNGCLAANEDTAAFSVRGSVLSTKLTQDRFGYLSVKDADLLRDAILLECEVFLTMERKLPQNAAHIEKELGIKIIQAIGYWDLLSPWASLLA